MNRIVKWQTACSDAKPQGQIAIYTCNYNSKHTLHHTLCTDVKSNFAAAACVLTFAPFVTHNKVSCTWSWLQWCECFSTMIGGWGLYDLCIMHIFCGRLFSFEMCKDSCLFRTAYFDQEKKDRLFSNSQSFIQTIFSLLCCDCNSAVEHLPGGCKVLGSSPITTKERMRQWVCRNWTWLQELCMLFGSMEAGPLYSQWVNQKPGSGITWTQILAAGVGESFLMY